MFIILLYSGREANHLIQKFVICEVVCFAYLVLVGFFGVLLPVVTPRLHLHLQAE